MISRTGRALVACGSCLNDALRAQAQWELDVSRTLLRRRKVLLLLALVPILLVMGIEFAEAALPETLGGRKAYLPTFVTPVVFWGSVFTGLLAGLITGVIGAGGGYILTPALMSFGVKGILAVGTDQFHLFAKAIMGTAVHRKLGNVNVWLAVWFVAGSALGVTLGGYINRHIYHANPSLSDSFISLLYVLFLGFLGIYALADWYRRRGSGKGGEAAQAETTALAQRLQALPWRPRVKFDQDLAHGGRSISVHPVMVCGFVVGLVAAVIGVGGGFLTFPMFVYGLGVSTFTTVGTDIFQIIFTTSYSSITQYAIYGYIFYTVALGMLLGSLIGVQIGALVTTQVRGSVIRGFYAITILAGFVNRLTALPRRLADAGFLSLDARVGQIIETVGVVLFFALVSIFALWVLVCFVRNLSALRGSQARAQKENGQP